MGVATADKPIGLTEAAQRLHVQSWQIGRALDKGLLQPRGRVGKAYYIFPTDLPAIAAALRELGYLESTKVG
jgi:hypothetical protein